MNRNIYCLLSLVFVTGIHASVFGGEITFKGTKVYSSEDALRSVSKYDGIKAFYKKFDVFELDRKALIEYAESAEYYPEFSLQFGKQFAWKLQLEKNELRRAGYKLIVNTIQGERTLPGFATTTYKGIANDDPNIRVRMTLSERNLIAFIRTADGDFYLEPASAFVKDSPDNHFVVYNTNDRVRQDVSFCMSTSISSEEALVAVDLSSATISGNACKEFDNANAAEYSYVKAYNGVAGAEERLLTILNVVAELYAPAEIEFYNRVTYLSACESCDPWSGSSDIVSLKDYSFTPWVSNGGFGPEAEFDGATLWTKRDLSGAGNTGVAGYATLSSICKTNKTIVVEAVGTGLDLHAVVQTHEYGHSFSCPHVGDNTTNVMSPTSSSTNKTWTSGSLSRINNYTGSVSCLAACSGAPHPEFSVDLAQGCGSLTVAFTNWTENGTTWLWDFGDGATSAQKHPTHTYNGAGTYNVTLQASGPSGNNTISKSQYISIDPGTYHPSHKVGPANNAIGDGDFTAGSDNGGRYMVFDALTDITLQSIKVYAGSPGERLFFLIDGVAPEGAPIILQKEIDLSSGEQRVDFNWNLEPGTYALCIAGTDAGYTQDLYRNTQGATYPYTAPGLLSITSNYWAAQGNALTGWYVGYDWEVREQGCTNTTGIEEAAFEPVVVYPNPSEGTFHFEIKTNIGAGALVSVYDLTGKKVHTTDLDASGRQTLNLDHLPDGQYLLVVSDKQKVISKHKILKL